jgi:4-amino-4-deoxy-L-arabinose transferase-like glycosyltransferase
VTSLLKRVTEAPPLALLAAFVILLTIVRVAILVATPLNLGPDEAQYWSWSLTPAFGYFSKPPMIAWIIGASTAICGDGEACIRVSAPLFHAATAIAIYFAGRALYDERVGLWSAVAYALMPGTSFSSLLITTDVPLLFFWALALAALAELRRTAKLGWAVLFGVAIGLGLLSKYAMLYFLLGIAIAYLPTQSGRAFILSRAGAIAAHAALAIFAPNVVWNALHSFATVGHTASNANWSAENLFNFKSFFSFLGAQIGIIGPIAAGIVVWGLIKGWRGRNYDHPDTLLMALSLPIIAIVAIQAFISRANANWAAPAFVALTILVVAWALRQHRTRLLIANAGLNAAIGVIVALLAVSPAFVSLIGQENSVKRLRGWDEAGRAIEELAAKTPFQAIVSDDREDMASLFYYTRARTVPLRMWPRETAGNEYEAAHALRAAETQKVLFVTRKTDSSDVTNAFASAERVATLETRLDSKRTRIFFVYALVGPVDESVFRKFFNRPSTDN